jgi:hypothetical protein
MLSSGHEIIYILRVNMPPRKITQKPESKAFGFFYSDLLTGPDIKTIALMVKANDKDK